MNRDQSLQHKFLTLLRKKNELVNVYLMNGIRLQGRIEAFDQFVVLVNINTSGPQMIYKHAISTIVPVRAVSLPKQEARTSVEQSSDQAPDS